MNRKTTSIPNFKRMRLLIDEIKPLLSSDSKANQKVIDLIIEKREPLKLVKE